MLIENGIKAAASVDACFGGCFSPLEWLVIAMGTGDDTRPLACSSMGRRLLELEAGGAGCLETLRRTAQMAARCGWGMPSAEVGAFLIAGWTEEQLGALIESVFQEAECVAGHHARSMRSAPSRDPRGFATKVDNREMHA
ncbi:hypothetical protein [Sphingomonas sp. NFR15]|uniref:hypothetical protein n=1 Tax=Sphingomonas sp. NFR15 TaxID=1566282 RepID=UPI0008801CE5|nr:hypothetical protein [Sphingomonas sp. NFR15]SDA35906.1 hypothetical protein SAMN03159340_03438 [Sphingomonas sp. NFR15]